MELKFDVVGVSIETSTVRLMGKDLTEANAEAFVQLAVMRRGVEDEFFAVCPTAKYRDGDKWLSDTTVE